MSCAATANEAVQAKNYRESEEDVVASYLTR